MRNEKKKKKTVKFTWQNIYNKSDSKKRKAKEKNNEAQLMNIC